MAVPQENQHRITTQPSSSTPREMHSKIWKQGLKQLLKCQYSEKYIQTSQKLETTQVSINRRMDNQTYTNNEILFSHKNNKILILAPRWMNVENILSEISQKWFHFYEIPRIVKFVETESRIGSQCVCVARD